MGNYLGDIAEDATIRGSFNTRDAAGAPITLAGSPTLAVYKDAGVGESTAGVTLTVDFDSRTGHHVYTIDTSADAFYATGSDYRVVITAGTVDGTSVVGVEVGSFSIQNRYFPSSSGLDAAGVRSAIGLASANLDTQLGDIPTVAEFNARSLPSADYFVVGDYTPPPSAVANASQVRTELATELARIDATISSRSTFAGGAVASVTGAVGSVTGNVGGNVVGTVASVVGSVGSVAAPVTVGTNNDKTGYSLIQSFPANFASLGINVSGHVERVVLVDTATTNTDMRGTDGANTTTPPTVSQIANEVQTRTISRVTLVDTTTTNSDMRGTDSALLASSYAAPANSTPNIVGSRITPGVAPRLYFVVLDSTGEPVTDLAVADITSIAYRLITGGVAGATSSGLSLTAAVVTDAHSTGSTGPVRASDGWYFCDAPVGAADADADAVELVVVLDDGTHVVYPSVHEIAPKVSTAQAIANTVISTIRTTEGGEAN